MEVPSSISNSETTTDVYARQTASDRPGVAQPVPKRPVPGQPWGEIILGAVALFAVLLGCPLLPGPTVARAQQIMISHARRLGRKAVRRVNKSQLANRPVRGLGVAAQLSRPSLSAIGRHLAELPHPVWTLIEKLEMALDFGAIGLWRWAVASRPHSRQ
jgi:hypothetical protein